MKKKRISSQIFIVAISLTVSFVFLFSFASQGEIMQNESYNNNGLSRAAILDQLHSDIPSKEFQEKATKYLETAGYEVDIYTTDELTVDFYKTLPKMNYKFIVFRSHAVGTDGPEYIEEKSVALFTGEKYADDKYIQEQLFGQLRKGAPFMTSVAEVSVDLSNLNESAHSEEGYVVDSNFSIVDSTDAYFTVGSKYVDELMEGNFPNSIMVLGGCSTLSEPSLAKSLINRGASSVVGWDRLVGSDRNDMVMLDFLENVLINDMEIEDAVQSVIEKHSLDVESTPTFTYHAPSLDK